MLGRTVAELEEDMTVEEFVEWSIFLRLRQEEQDQARKEAINNGKRSSQANLPGPGRHQ
jgi:hypothetical protein